MKPMGTITKYYPFLDDDTNAILNTLVDEQATLQDALNITDSLGVQTLRLKINSRIKEIHQLIQEEEMVSSVELKCDTCQPELSSYHAPSSIRLESDFRIMEQCAAVTL